jgi:hypothetical protein
MAAAPGSLRSLQRGAELHEVYYRVKAVARLPEMTSELLRAPDMTLRNAGNQVSGTRRQPGPAMGMAEGLAVAGCRAWCTAVFPGPRPYLPAGSLTRLARIQPTGQGGKRVRPGRPGSRRAGWVPAPRPRAGRCKLEIAAVVSSASSRCVR